MGLLALGLGSNLGNRLANLRRAASRAAAAIGPVHRASDVFETEPWGVTDQPCFLNACMSLRTDAEPDDLLRIVKNIEREMGRKESARWGARLIDLDLLLKDELVLDTPYLVIPHLHLPLRDFVLVPLMQILPDWRHPLLKKAPSEMLAKLGPLSPTLRIAPLFP
ncbi:MAG: 2-amino-4-hydroxy-6-hydroxymethyldihydropteridine diphosphokinase [Fretibacterium sp.]|nr:2-amino-4-hydroxy-6-hydroxymethyldihydropteridine diphosphokinase [Fretibacterium sp.]